MRELSIRLLGGARVWETALLGPFWPWGLGAWMMFLVTICGGEDPAWGQTGLGSCCTAHSQDLWPQASDESLQAFVSSSVKWT